MHQDQQVVLWSKWSGMTSWAGQHMAYGVFDHCGDSGGSHKQFTPRDETHLFGIRFGWWQAGPSDFVIYTPMTLEFMAVQAIYFADETPN